jgi:hypothetical protein
MAVWYKIYDIYTNVKCWFRTSFNKRHFKFVWKAFKSYPFDIWYDFETQRARFEELAYYHEHSNIAQDDEEHARQIRLAIKMIDIFTEKKELYHFTGEAEFKDLGNGTSELLPGNLEYHCDVYVNTRNIDRFIPKDRQKMFLKMPHDLYIEKAWTIYCQILKDYMLWWGN